MLPRNRSFIGIGAVFALTFLYLWSSQGRAPVEVYSNDDPIDSSWRDSYDDIYLWKAIPTHYAPVSTQDLPVGAPHRFPKVQASFGEESSSSLQARLGRRDAVKEAFLKSWTSYSENALGADELTPISGGKRNPFGGWAASLVDALDTLWIMDLKTEFAHAVDAVEKIDFTKTETQEINTFETSRRFLGAFLSAFDLSGDARLLRKAVQVGEMLLKAFDTPNHMPITRWDIHAALRKEKQQADSGVLLAEIGGMSMEFTRLSQLTGNPKWFDAIQRIIHLMAQQQDSTELPGLWPVTINAKDQVFNAGSMFTLGAMADSVYEYMPKMAALVGGLLPVYRDMYLKAMNTATKHNFFRPMTPSNEDILVSGIIHTNDREKEPGPKIKLEPQGQHLACVLGGVVALGGKLFGREDDLAIANKLTDGCVYAYKVFPHGIMPETFHMVPCPAPVENCTWDENSWKQAVLERAQGQQGKGSKADAIIKDQHLPKGFTEIPDRRYVLRSEAIESVFVLYRATGRPDLAESAWAMFQAINTTTATPLANTAVWDVTVKGEKPRPVDTMESFWMGETLKYFYLMFSEPSLISLDEYVFTTEAHPFLRPK